MNPSAPARLPLEELAEGARACEGRLDAAVLAPRIAEALGVSQARGRIEYAFEFSPAPTGAVAITGNFRARLEAQCQRCLEPFELVLDVPIRLLVPTGEEAIEAPPGWELIEPEMHPRLADLLEAELLLALPMAPLHAPEDCPARLPQATQEARTRPFAGLAQTRREEGD
ncbi:MAG: YceD family protein [Gammaproteobacteria bacterium]